MSKVNIKTLSGFMELLPEDQLEFDRIKNIIQSVYHQFGFTDLDTPHIERSEVLKAKGGDETDGQMFYVNNGTQSIDNDCALRFDLTVPLARYVANNFNNLTFPFRRCHIGKVYRGERAQKGRFREFYQCDIDVVSRNDLSIYYDAEIPNIIYNVFKKLKLGKFTIRISNRKLFSGVIEALKIEAPTANVLRLVDKAEKIPREKLLQGFDELGLTESQAEGLIGVMNLKGKPKEILASLKNLGIDNEKFNTGIEELTAVTKTLIQLGTDEDYFIIDCSIVRGLDYYTGTIYETILDDAPSIGSVCSGGRYDNLAGHYTSENLPGVGISIGLTRLFYQLKENGIIKPTKQSISQVIIVPDKESAIPLALQTATTLRDIGLNIDVLLDQSPIKKKLQYIDKKNAPYNIIVKTQQDNSEVLSLQYKKGDELVKDILTLEELKSYFGLVYFIDGKSV